MSGANKGEWTELYVLFKLLEEQKLYYGDENLEVSGLFYKIISIIREEESIHKKYTPKGETIHINIGDGKDVIVIACEDFAWQSDFLLKAIQTNKSKKGAFNIPETRNFMQHISCKKVKADSRTKSDIYIKIHDSKTGLEPKVGFSIKSRLGGRSTLLNPGKTTNWIYELKGNISREDISEFNKMKRFRKKFSFLTNKGITLRYNSMNSDVFEQNLMLIDTMMPELVSELLLIRYSQSISGMCELVKKLEQKNPLGFPANEEYKFYKFKVKRLLCDIALGMVPATPWNGYYEASGGYIIVKENGMVVCYHIYNKNKLEEYLFNNTNFDTASTSRYDFGKIYSKNGGHYLKLNAQIRFN